MSVHADLIYDIGFHKGEDTAFYLKKGFRVVAFEAHPRLAEQGRQLFADALGEGRFTMVEGAIVGADSGRPGAATVNFYINESKALWGTTQQSWVDRNARVGTASRAITVATVDFVGCLQTHGVPHFMKIDIEGSDWYCLEALRQVAERPDFVSIESERTDADRAQMEIALLESLGYRSFQIVQQTRVPWQVVPNPSLEGNACTHRFSLESSGLFGADLPAGGSVDRTEITAAYEQIFARHRAFGERSLLRRFPGMGRALWEIEKRFGVPLPGWYDTHARLGG